MYERVGFFHPITGQAVDNEGNILEGQPNAFDFTGGQWTIDRGQFVDVDNPFNRYSIGRQGPVRIQDFGNSRYSVIHQTLAGQVNQSSGPESFRFINGTTNVVTDTGDTVPLTMRQVAIAKMGRQWVAYPQFDGGMGFAQFTGPLETQSDVERVAGVGARLATAEEAATMALSYALASQNKSAMEDLAREWNMYDDNGNPDISGVMRRLLESLSVSQFQAFASFLVEG